MKWGGTLLGRKEFLFRQIGAKVAYYRKMRNLTQKELADKIHISRSSIGKIERGAYNHNISMSVLIDIIDGLEIELSMLFTFTEQEKKIWSKNKEGVSRIQTRIANRKKRI